MFGNRKNKKFNYTPRHSKLEKEAITKEEIKQSSSSGLFEGKRKKRASTLPILLIVLVLIIVFMYFLETKLR